MSNIVHDKYHRQNHHSFITSAVTDMGLDPIASKELPFSGEFVMDNADHNDWLLSSDRAAFEWVSGYNDTDSLKFDVGISGAIGKTIIYPFGEFGNVVIANGRTDVPSLSVVGKSIFTDDIVHDGNLTVSTINTTGISAGNILISGNDGFALNVTNGLSKFNDVTGGNFTITGNTGVAGDVAVGGDLNVHENLYFTSGIASGGFLNVAGSAFFENLKVGGKIEATNYYFERTTGINIPSDGGWKLSGTLSDEKKPLIPGKDSGAVSYEPGINNMTLSAMGLSSDSWVSFGGNVLIHGNSLYVDASETHFTEPLFVDGITGTKANIDELSGGDIKATYLSGTSATFDSLSGISLSAGYLSGIKATFNDLTGINLSGDKLTIGNLSFNNDINVTEFNQISADGIYFYHEPSDEDTITLTKNEEWGNGLITTQSLLATKLIEVQNTVTREDTIPGITNDQLNYKHRVPNIDFCDNEYFDYVPSRPRNQNQAYGDGQRKVYRITDYDNNYMPNKRMNTWEFRRWYHQASSRVWQAGEYNGVKHILECFIYPEPMYSLVNEGYELRFYVRLVFSGNSTLSNQITFQEIDADGQETHKYLSINRMCGSTNGKYLTYGELAGGNASSSVRLLACVYLNLEQGPIVQVIGRSKLEPSEGWFIK